jgi:hypothetical protein
LGASNDGVVAAGADDVVGTVSETPRLFGRNPLISLGFIPPCPGN